MRRAGRILVILVALLLVALAALRFLDDLFRETGPGFPTPLPASVLTPAPTPEADRRIAVLTLRVLSDETGEVRRVETLAGEVRPGFGPNVLNRPGAWTASLSAAGGEVLRYGLPDPREIHVEGADGALHAVEVAPEIVVDLVLPLQTAAGVDLAVQSIRLFDRSDRLIYGAALRADKVVPIPIEQLR